MIDLLNGRQDGSAKLRQFLHGIDAIVISGQLPFEKLDRQQYGVELAADIVREALEEGVLSVHGLFDSAVMSGDLLFDGIGGEEIYRTIQPD